MISKEQRIHDLAVAISVKCADLSETDLSNITESDELKETVSCYVRLCNEIESRLTTEFKGKQKSSVL